GGRVGAGNDHTPLAVVRAGRPDLLTVDEPVITVAHRARAQAGEIGAGARLAEQLAPDLFAAQHRPQIALLLLVRAVRHDRRPQHALADGKDARWRLVAAFFLVPDDTLNCGGAAAAVLFRPGDAGPAGIRLLCLPFLCTLDASHRTAPLRESGCPLTGSKVF